MSLKKTIFSTLFGAILLTLSMLPNAAKAQSENITASVTAIVANSFSLTETTPMHFGTMVVIADTSGTDTANIVLSTLGAGTINNSGSAQIIDVDTSTRTQGVYDVSGAAPSTSLTLTTSSLTDLSCGACSLSPPVLTLSAITDDAGATPTTDSTGAVTINMGATITTVAGGNQYEDGTYAGSFSLTLAY